MKFRPHPILVLFLIVIAAGAGGYWYFTNNPAAWQQVMVDFGMTSEQELDPTLRASGFIEAQEVTLSAEVGGGIERLAVARGDDVKAGQVLVEIDASALGAQRAQIEAQIALAEAQIAQLRAGVPPEQIAVAEAAVKVAEAERDAAYQDWQDAKLLRDDTQQIDAQIDAARSEVQIAQLQVEQAALLRDMADLGEDVAKEYWELLRDYPVGDEQEAATQWNLATSGVWSGYLNWDNAKAALSSAQSKLNTLRTIKERPLQGDLLVTQAEMDYKAKVAAVAVAQATLAQLRAPVPDAQIEVLEANREQARVQLQALETQRQKYVVTSPLDGVVVEKMARQGETALPGSPLLTVSDLEAVTLTVFVAEDELGRLSIGQTVEIRVDSRPGEVFGGEITRIGERAEFTPKNVQTQEERVSLVYAVEITIPNERGKLQAGIPADAAFVEARER